MSSNDLELVYGSNTFSQAFFERMQAAYTKMVPVTEKPGKGTRPRKAGAKPRKMVPDYFQRVGKGKLDLYWGETDESGRLVRIGIRGKFWILALLISQLTEEDDVGKIAFNISAHAGYSDDNAVRSGRRKHTYQDLIYDLISPTFKGTPHAETTLAFDFLLHAVGHLARLTGQVERTTELYEVLSASRYGDFAQLFERVCSLMGITQARLVPGHRKQLGPETIAAISQFDGLDGLPDQHGVRSEPTGHDKLTIKDVFTHLATARAPRLVVLHGEESAGKKAIVRHLMHSAAARADGHPLYRMPETEDDPARYTPIFAIQAKRRTYVDLVRQVCRFVVRYHNEFATDDERVSIDVDLEIWEGLQIIREYHRQPALFVMTDVEIAPENRLRPHIRDSGFRRLLSALFDGHKQSRIIITTTADWDRLHPSVQAGLPIATAFPVRPPSLTELKYFVRPELQALSFPETWQARLRGHVLVALGAYISLHDGIPADLYKALEPMNKQKVQEPVRKAFRADLYDWLRDKVGEEGLLPALTLIALSEDGLRSDTLHEALAQWRQVNEDVEAFTSPQSLEEKLTQFGVRTGSKFLKYSKMVRYDKDEYGPEEAHTEDDKVWEFDPLVAQRFILAVQTKDPPFARIANRIIAIAARRRAQNKKRMSSQSGRYDTTADGSRDIQSFTSLLASIPMAELAATSNDDAPGLPLLSTVFTLGKNFNARNSFRYALYAQLRDDVDRENRMTMVDDEDDLRLHLYLLLLQTLGQRHNLEDETLKLGIDVPAHLNGLIDLPDIFDLFMTIGLSAFHAQRPDMLWTAIAAATDLVNREAPGLIDDLARLWSVLFDYYILRGESEGRFVSAEALGDQKGHQKTLRELEVLISDRFSSEEDLLLQSGAALRASISTDPYRVAAWLRLRMRVAELTSLINPDRSVAMFLYERLWEIDNILAERARPGRGMIVAGRTARHYIRFLFRSPAFHNERTNPAFEAERQQSLETIAALIEVNSARLRRYAGADRVGVLLDQARWYYFKGDLTSAVKYAGLADSRSFMTNVSHNGRLDVLVMNADLAALQLYRQGTEPDRDIEKARDLLARGQDDVDELLRLALRLKYRPYQGVGQYLRSKLAYIAHQVGLTDDIARTAHTDVVAAQETMEAICDFTFKDDMAALEGALNEGRFDLTFY